MHFWKEARGLAKNVKRVTCEKEAFIFSDKLMNHKRDSHAVFAMMHALLLVLQMFFRKSYNAAYDTRKHGNCRFFSVGNDAKCAKCENLLGRKWYIQSVYLATI